MKTKKENNFKWHKTILSALQCRLL